MITRPEIRTYLINMSVLIIAWIPLGVFWIANYEAGLNWINIVGSIVFVLSFLLNLIWFGLMVQQELRKSAIYWAFGGWVVTLLISMICTVGPALQWVFSHLHDEGTNNLYMLFLAAILGLVAHCLLNIGLYRLLSHKP